MRQTGSLSLVVLQKLSEGGSYWRLEQRRSPCPVAFDGIDGDTCMIGHRSASASETVRGVACMLPVCRVEGIVEKAPN